MTAAKSTWLALLFLVAAAAAAPRAGSFGAFHRITAASPARKPIHQIPQIRGGAVTTESDSDYDEDEYDSEYEDEEAEPIVVTAKKLATSTKAAVQKKKTAAIKSKVKVAMATSSSKSVAKKTSGGSMYKRYVPYIVRACVNPFTLFAMTKAYFMSLCDINYLKEDDAQTLRSALQDKARKQNPSSGSPKPTRKMKPGQAKTLSDLPQLSA